MSDLSEIDILNDDSYSNRLSQGDSDFLENSSEDEDPKISQFKAIKKARIDLEKERKGHLGSLFYFLQDVVLDGKPRQQNWRRGNVISRALDLLKQLKKEENQLLIDFEDHLQENFLLKRQLSSLYRKKKKKPAGVSLIRRVSSITLTPSKLSINDNRRVSLDDSKLAIANHQISNDSHSILDNEVAKPSELPPRSKKNRKKRSELTEEEKEYYNIHEKIEDFMAEVDAIWEDVKDDEELMDDDELDRKIKVDVKSEFSPFSSCVPPVVSSTRTSSRNLEVPKLIAITDINKLMSPKFVKKVNSSRKSLSEEAPCRRLSNGSSKSSESVKPPELKCVSGNSPDRDSSDEDKLVIDETPPPPPAPPIKKDSEELNLLEALQAVDNLCREIIPDMDEPELSPEPAPKKRPQRKTRASKRFSDVIVIDDD